MNKKPLILIVDDSRANISLLANILWRKGYAIAFAEKGEQALKMIERAMPDLVLLDIQMPRMNGYEVCRNIRRSPATRHIPVIFITAFRTGDEDVVKGFEAGASDYITKPFQASVLLARVRTHISLQQAHADLQSQITALRKSELRYRAVVEDQTELIWRYLPDRSLTFVNRAFCRYMEKSAEELLTGRPFYLPIHPDDRENTEKILSSISSLTSVCSCEHRILLPGNRICWIERSDRILWDEVGDQAEYQAVARDISDRKKLEKIQKKLREQEMEKLMKAGDRMSSLGRVSAGIAHEIRNPLSTINVYLKILGNLLDRPDMRDEKHIGGILSELEFASGRIEKIVKRVVDFARPCSPQLCPASVNTCIREALALSAATLRKEEICLEEKLDDTLPECMLESQSVSQVLLNLISNAAEAMKKQIGNKCITVSSEREEKYILVKVADSGPGIDFRDTDRIFNPFYSTKPGGLGIGLSITRRIIRDHSGTLEVGKSDRGGAELRIRFPLAEKVPEEKDSV